MTKSLLEKPAVVVVNAKEPVVEAMERSTEDVIVESGQVVRPRGHPTMHGAGKMLHPWKM